MGHDCWWLYQTEWLKMDVVDGVRRWKSICFRFLHPSRPENQTWMWRGILNQVLDIQEVAYTKSVYSPWGWDSYRDDAVNPIEQIIVESIFRY